ncbi:MAG TPA: HEAT repeat domain-containing protein [Vicinamibacterales bacterium]|nr:HEAT repeat domain-containing protein [Vicinamibacterales bacterium]
MAWILRLEEDRVLQAPEPPPPVPPAVSQGRRGAPAVTSAVPAQPSLPILVTDSEARIRRRAALAIGRTRLPEGIPALLPVLSGDVDAEVRQMAAFALGLIGDAQAADPLLTALADPDPLVQGRAAEAIGMLGHNPGAGPITEMMSAHTKAGVLDPIAPDDLEHPKAPAVEAVRLGMYALVRLGAYDQLATVMLNASGQPISRWWPVAYAFRRINDPRAGSALLLLLQGDGIYTRAFAARGLGVVKETRAVTPLVAVLSNEREATPVRVEAARSVAELGAGPAVEPLVKIVASTSADPNLRLEALTALGQLRASAAVDLFVDLLTERWPSMRAAALVALARTDPDTFVLAISGLDVDRHWSVRAALATALAGLGLERAQPRLVEMLKDQDQRVIPAVLTALSTLGAADAEPILVERLTHDDVVVRQAAAAGLARVKARTAVPALVAAYDVAVRDPTYIARAAILDAVLELDREAGRSLLDRALADQSWAMRVRAAALGRGIDPEADVRMRIRPAPASAVPELNDLGPMIDPSVTPVAYVDTTKGLIQIELAVLDAPRTVANFISLARRNFFGATSFHRVVPNFVAQDGDPRGDGEGSPGYTIRDEINQLPYLRGTVGMALDWEDTGGSQFFITHAPQPHLDARYTVFGRVVNGMEVVDGLQQWDQVLSVRVWDGVNWIGGPQ